MKMSVEQNDQISSVIDLTAPSHFPLGASLLTGLMRDHGKNRGLSKGLQDSVQVSLNLRKSDTQNMQMKASMFTKFNLKQGFFKQFCKDSVV